MHTTVNVDSTLNQRWLLDRGFPAAGFGWILVEQRHDQISTLNQRWNNVVCLLGLSLLGILMCTGKCLKPEQFLKAKHLLKHAFLYRDKSFYGPDR